MRHQKRANKRRQVERGRRSISAAYWHVAGTRWRAWMDLRSSGAELVRSARIWRLQVAYYMSIHRSSGAVGVQHNRMLPRVVVRTRVHDSRGVWTLNLFQYTYYTTSLSAICCIPSSFAGPCRGPLIHPVHLICASTPEIWWSSHSFYHIQFQSWQSLGGSEESITDSAPDCWRFCTIFGSVQDLYKPRRRTCSKYVTNVDGLSSHSKEI